MVLSYYDYFTTLSLVPYFLLFVYHSSNPKPPENQHTYEERKEKMKDLIGAANTRSPGTILIRFKDILYFSKSIFKLETLRKHNRSPRIREESQSLFTSLLKTLYSQGSDKSVGLNKARLKKPKKQESTRFCLELKTNPFGFSLSDKKQDHKTLAREPVVRTETKTDACKSCGLLKDADKISSVTTTALPHQSRQDIKDKDGKVTTKIPRVSACKNVPVKDSRNPKPAGKTEEMVELFEAAKKKADVANAKCIYSLWQSRCVEAISLLMKINVTPNLKEPRRMIERLQGLTKHKDRAICNAGCNSPFPTLEAEDQRTRT
uniref:Transcription elongation factor TFIIS/CRSP70 N-terminal sub-type domain-containing protein n=1 Tax=Brassica oleracea TaxID=3712 RepID=A0A3P6GDK8_BRAOL|nr:unnamed protein product [Brassica oleracea]